MVDVKRKRGETFDSLLRRFNRRLQLSGRVLEAKRTRFKKKQPNKNLIREKKHGVKILGSGNLQVKLTIEGCQISLSAKEKIEAAGGSIK